MAEPLAAMRSVERDMERSEGEAGYTLSSAPESIKKYRPDRRSKTDMEDRLVSLVVLVGKPAAFIDDRPDRFPRPALSLIHI